MMRLFLTTTAEAAIMMASGIGVGLILEGSKQQAEGTGNQLNETAILVAVALFACAIMCRYVVDFQRTESCIRK